MTERAWWGLKCHSDTCTLCLQDSTVNPEKFEFKRFQWHIDELFNLQLDLQIGGRLSCCGCHFFKSTSHSIIVSKELLLRPEKREELKITCSYHRSHILNFVVYCESSRSSTNRAEKLTEERQFNVLCFHFINTVGTIGIREIIVAKIQ